MHIIGSRLAVVAFSEHFALAENRPGILVYKMSDLHWDTTIVSKTLFGKGNIYRRAHEYSSRIVLLMERSLKSLTVRGKVAA